jgi:hypothetical protein
MQPEEPRGRETKKSGLKGTHPFQTLRRPTAQETTTTTTTRDDGDDRRLSQNNPERAVDMLTAQRHVSYHFVMFESLNNCAEKCTALDCTDIAEGYGVKCG